MKKFFSRRRTLLLSCGIAACLVCIAFLCASLAVTISAAQKGKENDPEPAERPDIRAGAYWDSELGMYVDRDGRGGSVPVLTEEGPGLLSDGGIESPEEAWLKEHSGSQNAVDRAILASVEAARREPPSLLSSVSARDSIAIRESMSALSVSDYPEVWERLCTEPVYRAQKIVALENFLNLSFDELGLYDAAAQRMWYDSFVELKSELSALSVVSRQDVEKFGRLLLPVLADRAEKGTLSGTEQAALLSLLDGEEADAAFSVQQSLSREDIAARMENNAERISVIREILSQNWEWVS